MRRLVIAAILVGLAPSAVAAQGVSIAPKAGSTGFGGDLILSLAPKLALKGGVGFSLVEFDLDLGSQRYRVEPPPVFVTAAVDIRLTGPIRIMAGLLHRTDDVRFGGDLTGAVEIGDATFNAPGRLEGALISTETAPFLGIGLGSLGGRGMGLYLDLAVAFTGDPDVALTGSGPITSEPDFDVELEKERLSILGEIDDYYRYWPIVNLGFRIHL
jgi:hypothetical protein